MGIEVIITLIGILIPVIVAVIQTFKKRGSDNIITTLIDSVNAAKDTIDEVELKVLKGTITDFAIRNGVEGRLYKLVKKREKK